MLYKMKQSVVNDKQIVDIHIQTGIILRMIFFTVIQQKIRFSYSTASFYRIQTAIPIDPVHQSPPDRRYPIL